MTTPRSFYDSYNNDDADAGTSIMGDGILTPATSNHPEPVFISMLEEPSVPWPGSTYMITTQERQQSTTATKKLAMAVMRGELVFEQLTTLPSDDRARLWECCWNDGFCGFRNLASGDFLGHDPGGAIVCVQPHHKSFEYFVCRAKLPLPMSLAENNGMKGGFGGKNNFNDGGDASGRSGGYELWTPQSYCRLVPVVLAGKGGKQGLSLKVDWDAKAEPFVFHFYDRT